ncbi:hypothetical protein HDU81_004479 [Chytriomyces hyalinus]|nr:hypothetical protein HDU81_004479 [Chytriomyces hyalinus]
MADNPFSAAALQKVTVINYTCASIQTGCVLLFLYQVLVCETIQSQKKVAFSSVFTHLNCTLFIGMLALISFYLCNAKSNTLVLHGHDIPPSLYFGPDLSLAMAVNANFLFSWWRSFKIIRLIFKEHFKLLERTLMILCVFIYAPVVPSIALMIDPGYFHHGFLTVRQILFGMLAVCSTLLDFMFIAAFAKYLRGTGLNVEGDARFRLISMFGISSSFWNFSCMAMYVIGVCIRDADLQMVVIAVAQSFASGCVLSLLGMKIVLHRVRKVKATTSVGVVAGIGKPTTGGTTRDLTT